MGMIIQERGIWQQTRAHCLINYWCTLVYLSCVWQHLDSVAGAFLLRLKWQCSWHHKPGQWRGAVHVVWVHSDILSLPQVG